MIADRRKPFKIGGSKGVTLPKKCQIGESVTMACNSRLILVNTTGQIHEDDLLRFLIKSVQPMFRDWWRNQKETNVLDNYVRLGRKIVNGN